MMTSLSRLLIMAITYDLLTVDIEGISGVESGVVEKACQRNTAFLEMFAEYLVRVIDIPAHARKLMLSRGIIRREVQSHLTRDNHATVLSWIEAGTIPLDIARLDQLFEMVCQSSDTAFPFSAFALD